MKVLQKLLRRLILWAARDYFEETLKQHLVTIVTTTHAACDRLAKENVRQWRLLNNKIASLQAIDVPFSRDGGKIAIIARVGGRDIVQVIDIAADITMKELSDMIRELEQRFGARPSHVDGPPAAKQFLMFSERDAATRRR